MKDLQVVKVEERGALCCITLNRPEAGNCISVQMLRDLEEVCNYLDDESPSSVVVFRGAGGTFTKGIDLADFSSRRAPDIHGFNKWERVVVAIERLRKVTVAAVEGECIGGGVQVALACDFRLATEEAVFLLDEVKRGFLPGLATYRLAKYLGLGRAKQMILSCQPVAAMEALRIGLADRVCPAAKLDEELDRLVMEFLPVNGSTVALARRLLNESFAKNHEDFLGGFLAAQHKCITSEPFIRILQEAYRQDD